MRILILLLLLSATAQADWYRDSQAIMGTEVEVDAWHASAAQARRCANRVFGFMRHVDEQMSPYLPDSELARVNREAARHAVRISQELFDLIVESIHYSEISNGAFDITFSSVGYLYDYRQHQQPDEKTIHDLLPAVNFRLIQLDADERTIRFLREGVRIDLGGIAKGYAVDQSIRLLKDCGVEHAWVKAGGDSYLLGDRNGQPWILGVRHPRQKDKMAVRLPLSDVAVSTSGDYERFFIKDGERIHHILTPATGKPARDKWSVTVMADTATMSDALSTALFVMDRKAGLALIDKLDDVDAIIIDADGNMHYSSGLQAAESVTH